MRGVETIDLPLTKSELAGLRGKKDSVPTKLLVTKDIAQLPHVWPRSNDLGGARCYAFQCADLLKLYCDTVVVARKAEPLFVTLMDQRGEPLLLMGLTVESHRSVRVLKFIDGGLSDLNTPVVLPSAEDLLPQAIEAILSALKTRFALDIVVFDKMPRCVGDVANPMLVLPHSKEFYSCHSMSLGKPWKIQRESKSKTTNLSRKRKRLSRRGDVTFHLAETSEQFDHMVEVLDRQKTQRYLETRGRDGLSRPGYREFLRSAGVLRYPNGPVCLFALMVDDAIVATVLGYVVGSRFYYLMPSFDTAETWRFYSVGHLLIMDVADWCYAKGLTTFDFGLGDEPYKDDYCDVSTELYRVERFFTARGAVYLLLQRGWIKALVFVQTLKRLFNKGAQ